MAIDNNLSISAKTGGNYDPIPEDTYQVQIVDVTQKQRETQWGLKDKFQFNCAVVEGEYKDRLVFISVNIAWSNGEGNAKRPSQLFNLVKTVYAHYQPKVKVSEMDGLTGAQVNDLIGKQLIAVVKLSPDGKYNNVTDFMKIKSPVTYEPSVENGNEDINPEDIKI